LLGLKYEPLFPYFADTENAFQVVNADFVTTEDGRNKYDFAKEYTMRTHMQTF